MHSSTTKSMYTQWNHAVLCTIEIITFPYIALKETYDIIHDIIDDVTDDVIKIEYWKVFPLNAPFYRFLIDQLGFIHLMTFSPPFPCHVLMTAIIHYQTD